MTYQVGKISMPQKIILAHLRSMRQQLNYIVQQHLSPLEIREYFLSQEFEALHIEDLSSDEISEDEFTARYQDSNRIQMLTDALDEDSFDPFLWEQRGITWNRMGELGPALSDFVRSLQQWSNKIKTGQIPSPKEQESIEQMLSELNQVEDLWVSRFAKEFNNLDGQ